MARTALARTRQPYMEGTWVISRVTAKNALEDPAVRGVIIRSEEQIDNEILDSLAHTSGRFQSLAEAAPVGIVVLDADGRPIYRNDQARTLLGPSGDTGDWLAPVRESHRDDLRTIFADTLQQQERGSTLVPFDHHGGTTWLKIEAVPQTDGRRRPFGLIATLQDVTAETEARDELREAQDRLWQLANHDQLTGLPNRSLFTDRLHRALLRLRRDQHGVALLYGDLDGFKELNDRFGHQAGDHALVEVAHRISDAVRDTDTACRFGGDEFLVLVEGFTNPTEVEAVATRVITGVNEAIPSSGASEPELRVGITIGIAIAGPDTSVGALLARADHAMYRAKDSRKGSFFVHS